MKKILISPKVVSNPNYYEISNILDFEYIRFFEDLGYQVIIVPNNTKNLEMYLELIDIELIVLSGGNNVNPSLYNSIDELDDVFTERDETEAHLIKSAVDKSIPLLGVCRGFHMINVYFGGSLEHGIIGHVRNDHELISKNLILNGKITNTYHNQGIFKAGLSSELLSIAETEDGYIEAFKHKKYKILGVQWHPERQNKRFDRELIESFLKGDI